MVVKVGDKVRSLVTEMDVVAGNEYRVIGVLGTIVHVTDAVGDRYPLEAGEWKPLTADEVTDNDKPPFKAGDRVRLIKDGQSTTGAIGKLATIESWGEVLINNGQYLLNIDGPVDYQTHAVTPNYTRATPDCFELVLKIEAGKFYRSRDGRKVGPMEFVSNNWFGVLDGISKAYGSDGKHGNFCIANQANQDLIAEWVDDANEKANSLPVTLKFTDGGMIMGVSEFKMPTIKSPSIVARIDNGQPMPAARPLVHDTKEDAEKEAKRLSEKHRGKEFGVFTLIAKHQTEAVYDHEWQRLAANGNRIGAIKAIRELTGFGLKAAKDGLEDWLSRNAA